MKYRVTTTTGEHEFVGSPREIVAEMSTMDFEGGLNGYMDRVRERVTLGFELKMLVTDRPLTFLKELQRLGFINLEPA